MTEVADRRIAVIVVAAGQGTRLGADHPKALVTLAGRSLLERSIDAVREMSGTPSVIVVAPADYCEVAEHQSVAALQRPVEVVPGGVTRQASVAAGLDRVKEDIDVVLVHDAARCLTPAAVFDRVAEAVFATGEGVIPGVPVNDTIKRVGPHGVVNETVDRSQLAAVQTPQGFRRNELVAAYASASRDETDDAALMSAAGHSVRVIEGDALAFKITTPWDLHRAQQLLTRDGESRNRFRIGYGVDTHAFAQGAELWLAGLFWPGEAGLAGHSDGDAVVHAIVDALLSASGLGDIGHVFGTDDPEVAGAHADVFLRETRTRVEAAGYRIGNVSAQFVGNRPRFAARRAEAQEYLSTLLQAPVSLGATTSDGLGFTGRGEGIAAYASVLLYNGQ